MDPLHRRDDPQLGEAWDVVRVEVLAVLDPPPPIRDPTESSERGFHDVQRLTIRPVPDGVDSQLKAHFRRDSGRLLHVGNRSRVQPRAGWQVFIGLQEPGSVGPQGAIDGDLDRGHPEVVVPVAVRLVLGLSAPHC